MARALLSAAEDGARARGARKLSLRTFSTNPQAIRLYTRFGFEREGLLRGEFLIEGQYVDDILLAKDLTGPSANGLTDDDRAPWAMASGDPLMTRNCNSNMLPKNSFVWYC